MLSRTQRRSRPRIGLRLSSSEAARLAYAGAILSALEGLQDGVSIDARWRDLPLVPTLPDTPPEALDTLHLRAQAALALASERDGEDLRRRPRNERAPQPGVNIRWRPPNGFGWGRIGAGEEPASEAIARLNGSTLAGLELSESVRHLGRFVFVEVPNGASTDELLDDLRRSGFEAVWLESEPAPAPVFQAWTPEGLPPQFWDAPGGTDARYSASLGAFGGGVRLVDIEHAFGPHVELGVVHRLGGADVAREAYHGTAVLGLIAGREAVVGGVDVRGLAPAVELGFVSLWFDEPVSAAPSIAPSDLNDLLKGVPVCRCVASHRRCTCHCAEAALPGAVVPPSVAPGVATYRPYDALLTALSAQVTRFDGTTEPFLRKGDVLLLEAQRWHRTSDADPGVLLPLETDPMLQSLIAHAVALEIIVVAAAGNGGVDLGPYSLADTGSICVGAAVASPLGTGHVVSRFGLGAGSNFGARVRTYGWGDSLVVPGGDSSSVDPTVYTDSFGGTSGAAAQVAATVAAIQSAVITAYGAPLNGAAIGALLEDTVDSVGGAVVADATVPSVPVGLVPDLRRILRDVLKLTPDVFVERTAGDTGDGTPQGFTGDAPAVRGQLDPVSGTYVASAKVLRRDGGPFDASARLRLGLLVPSTCPRLDTALTWAEAPLSVSASAPDAGNGAVNLPAVPYPMTVAGRTVDPIALGLACFVAVADAPGDPVPRLETYGDAYARRYLLEHENNVAFQTGLSVAATALDALPFLLEGPLDDGRAVELELSWGGLPVGTGLSIAVEGGLPGSLLVAPQIDPTKLVTAVATLRGKATLLAGPMPAGVSRPALLKVTLPTPLTAEAWVSLSLLEGAVCHGRLRWNLQP